MDINLDIFTLFAVIAGYLLGSIPFGFLLMRVFGHGDIRTTGSGNIGATNVLRSGQRMLALLTLILDAAKGIIAIQVALELGGASAIYPAALACFLGHLFPFWLGFKGGKGIATFLGLIVMLSPLTGIMFMLCWLILAGIFRYASLASLLSILLSLIMLAVLGETPTLYVVLAITLLTFYAHRQNIVRLFNGTENSIGQNS